MLGYISGGISDKIPWWTPGGIFKVISEASLGGISKRIPTKTYRGDIEGILK